MSGTGGIPGIPDAAALGTGLVSQINAFVDTSGALQPVAYHFLVTLWRVLAETVNTVGTLQTQVANINTALQQIDGDIQSLDASVNQLIADVNVINQRLANAGIP